MTIEEGLRAFLIADAGVAALVGDKVFTETSTEGVHDGYVSFSRDDTANVSSFEGPSGAARYELSVVATSAPSAAGVSGSADNASDIADAVELALDGYDGAMGAIASVGATMEDRDSDYDHESDTHTVNMVFIFWV